MAMLQCPECGQQISDQAAVCPHCGYRVGKRLVPGKRSIAVFGAVLLVAGIMLSISQTTVFWSKEDRFLLKCVKAIQQDLLAPDSIQIYDAGVLDCTQEESGKFVVTDENGEEIPINRMGYVYYGAMTKGGGVADGLYAFREVQGARLNVFPYTDADQRDPADMSDSERDQAMENALRSIAALDIMEDVIAYGEGYSEKSIDRVLRKAVR